MSFSHPYLLFFAWAAAALLLVVFLGMSQRRRLLKRYAADEGLTRLAGQVSAGRRYVRAILAAAALVFMVIALAGPRYGYHWEEIQQKGVDLVVALDCSRSMLAEDVDPSRLVRAKREIVDLIGKLAGDRLGLVAFGGDAFLQCPLTLDYSAFNIFLDALTPDFLPRGGTNLGAAVDTSMSAFDTEVASDKAIILITDGESTTGPDPVAAARKAAEKGVRLFTIGVGAEQGAPVPGENGGFKRDDAGRMVVSRLDEETLEKMAAVTGGIYVRSEAGDMDLDAIYQGQIQKNMKKEVLESGRKRVRENRFQWFAALALLCLLAERLVPVRKTLMVLLLAALLLPAGSRVQAAGLYDEVRQGRQAYEQGEYEKALKHFIEAQLKDPENPRLLYNIGDAYYKNKEYQEAARHFQDALKQAEDDEASLRRNILYNLGNTRFKQHDFKAAIDFYKQALDLDETDQQARDNLELARQAREQQKRQEQEQEKKREQEKRQEQEQEQEKGQRSGEQEEQQPDRKKDRAEESGKDGRDSSGDQPEKDKSAADDKEAGDKSRQTGTEPEQAEDESQSEEQASPSSRDSSGEDERDGDRAAGQERSAPGGDTPGASIGADRLNRLEDKPGAAMLPAYKGRKVEKDW
ncbi:MAG: VWA domain-containing protein [Desulfosudaceae bacterium]